jgi:hypothetical protein
MERRQLLLEAMDKLARYQRHYRELHGRFTRDLARLSLPAQLASGSQEALRRNYELSVLEVRPNRFLLLATGLDNPDRVTIDENHRINANFVLPPPSRAYLYEEADRLMRLRAQGQASGEGLFSRYWKVDPAESLGWVAVGQRNPVLGERRELSSGREVSSLFTSVREKTQNRIIRGRFPSGRAPAADAGAHERYKGVLAVSDVKEWLAAAHLAQHLHFRERGQFAQRWEELDGVSDYGFANRMRAVKNLRVHPIELVAGMEGYRLTLEGTTGELLGEQFVIDRSGSVRQVRYTETLIQQLQETTSILENFQINPIFDDRP